VNIISGLIMFGIMIVEIYIYYIGIDCYHSDEGDYNALFMFLIIAPIMVIISLVLLISTFNDCCTCCTCNRKGSVIGILVQFAIKVVLVVFSIVFFSLTLKLIIGLFIINVISISLALINKKFFTTN